MSNLKYIKRLESIEALAKVLINEATKAKEEIQQQESGNSPAARKGQISKETIAMVRGKFRNKLLKKASALAR